MTARSTNTALKFPAAPSAAPQRARPNPARSDLSTSLTLAAMSLGYGVVQLDVTIVNTALGSIGSSLGGGVSELQWVVSAYTIAFAAFILTAGALGDRIGAKRVFMAGFAVFTAASVGCALSPNATILIAARAVQGFGAAILVPNSLALLSHAYPDDKARGRAVGIWAAGASLALTAGPLVGGGLIALVGWRSIFLVNLPIGLAGLWLSWRYASETTRSPQREIDLPGQLAAIAALGCLAGAIIEGGSLGWSNGFVIAGFIAAAVLAILFVLQERRASQPMLPLSLFAHRIFALTSMVGLLVNVAFYGLIFVFSLYFQRVNGWSPFATGLAFVPMMGAVLPVNLLAPRLAERIGAPATIAVGAVLSRGWMSGVARDRAGHQLRLDLRAADRDRWRPRPFGAAADVDAAGQRREAALRHCRRRAQRDAADRQRVGRGPVRLARGSSQRAALWHTPIAGDFRRPAAGRGRCDLVWRFAAGRAVAAWSFGSENQNRSSDSCFDAFSSREPVSTSLENALAPAQGKVRATKRHRRAEHERGDPREHARDGRDCARPGGDRAGADQQENADRDQELPHPLRDLSGHRAMHQIGGEIAAAKAHRRDQPPRDRRSRRHEFAGIGPPEAAEVEAEARAEHVHGQRQQHARNHRAGQNQAAWKIDRLGHAVLVR